jgi:hypothetical protein
VLAALPLSEHGDYPTSSRFQKLHDPRAAQGAARIEGGNAMLRIDWRSPTAYGHAKTIPAAGFAWEYLRRNDSYQRDVMAIGLAALPQAEQAQAFEKRWGMMFSKRSRIVR